MGILKNLEGPDRLGVIEAITESFSNFGEKSINSYCESANFNNEGLLKEMTERADSFGWGIWEFNLNAKSLVLYVRNSPFAEGYGESPTAVCASIKGMFAAISRQIFGKYMLVLETECEAVAGQGYYKFICNTK